MSKTKNAENPASEPCIEPYVPDTHFMCAIAADRLGVVVTLLNASVDDADQGETHVLAAIDMIQELRRDLRASVDHEKTAVSR